MQITIERIYRYMMIYIYIFNNVDIIEPTLNAPGNMICFSAATCQQRNEGLPGAHIRQVNVVTQAGVSRTSIFSNQTHLLSLAHLFYSQTDPILFSSRQKRYLKQFSLES
jgi:hypothetical protein